jgi:hypothetical protein
MRLDRTRLARLHIDPLTAAEIGWVSRMRDGQEDINEAGY